MNFMKRMHRKDFYSTISQRLDCPRQMETLTHQLKEPVNQKRDVNEWKGRGLLLIIFSHLRFASGYDQNQIFINDVR